jgi:hypothetical protein
MTARSMLLSATAALLLAAGPALAQAPAAPGAAPPGAEASSPSRPARGPGSVEARITELHQNLRITAQEEPQFRAFADVMRANAAQMNQVYQAGAAEATTGNAVDQLRRYADVTREHADEVQALLPPFQALYAALSPEQQHLADQMFRQAQERMARRDRARG